MSQLARFRRSGARAYDRCHLLRARIATLLAREIARLDAWLARQNAQAVMFGIALGLCLATQVARADATVIVELKRPDGSSAEGTVRLVKADLKLECTTQQGRCQLPAVPGGTYTVEVVQADKGPGKPKRVMIPPAGEVKLIVAAQ